MAISKVKYESLGIAVQELRCAKLINKGERTGGGLIENSRIPSDRMRFGYDLLKQGNKQKTRLTLYIFY